MKITASITKSAQPPSHRAPISPPKEEGLDAYFAADAALVVGGLGLLAAPAVAGATLGLAGVATAAVGGAVLDHFVSDENPDPNASKYAATVTLATLAGAGAVLGMPAVLATAGVLGACGLMLSLVDTYGH